VVSVRKLSYMIAIAFVIALVAQWAVVAQAATSTKTTTHKTTPAYKGKGPAVEKVKATEKDYSITLSPDTVKPGKVQFTIKNDGKVAHEFAVKGNGIDKKMPGNIAPGKTRQLTVDLTKAGKYEVYCPVHLSKGMKTTLTVK